MSTRSGSVSALLVVDVQVGVVANAWDRDRVVGNVALAVRRAREAGLAIVWVQHADGNLVRDTPAWRWVPELAPSPDDLLVHKQHNSAFEGTELLSDLDRLGVSRIFLAGAATNWCIRATAYRALERGFDVTLLSDAHTTESMEVEPGTVVEAQSVVADLNTAMRWLSYPERTTMAVTASDAVFA